MLNPWALALGIAAVIALVLSRRIPHAWMWIGLGALSFIASGLYWDWASLYGSEQDIMLHPVFTLACDALICLAAHWWAREKWELGIFLFYLTSVFCSLLKIAGFIPNNIVYASMLELCNWAALLLIGGVGLMDRLAHHEDSAFGRLRRSLHSARHSL